MPGLQGNKAETITPFLKMAMVFYAESKVFHGKNFPIRGAYVMSRKKNLSGMRFGKLTAVEPTSERKNGYTIWICKCDCGNIVRVPSRFLKNGWSSSCGCEGKKEAFEDLTGKRFG